MSKGGSVKDAAKILFVTTEIAPFSKVGGLGDVAGSLPKALKQTGVDVRVVTPAWPGVLDKAAAAGIKTSVLPRRVYASYNWQIRDAEVIKAEVGGVPVYFLRAEDYNGDMYPPELLDRVAVRRFLYAGAGAVQGYRLDARYLSLSRLDIRIPSLRPCLAPSLSAGERAQRNDASQRGLSGRV